MRVVRARVGKALIQHLQLPNLFDIPNDIMVWLLTGQYFLVVIVFFFHSLSLLSTNLSGEQETELRKFMAKRLARGTVYSGSGNISTLEDFFPDESAVCYYCFLRGGKEDDEGCSDHHDV